MVRPRAQALCGEAGRAGLSAQLWKESKEQPADTGKEVTEMMGPGFSQQHVGGGRERESDTEPGYKAECKENLKKTH